MLVWVDCYQITGGFQFIRTTSYTEQRKRRPTSYLSIFPGSVCVTFQLDLAHVARQNEVHKQRKGKNAVR